MKYDNMLRQTFLCISSFINTSSPQQVFYLLLMLSQQIICVCVCAQLQWTMSELACYTYSLVSVPLYDTLGTEAIDYIIDKGKAA